MQTPVSLSCERKGTGSYIHLSLPQKASFCQSPRTSYPFFLPCGRPSFSPHSFPFSQPCLCYHKSPDELETQWSRRQHQPSAPAPSSVPGRTTAASQGPAAWDAPLCPLGSQSHTPSHKNTLDLYYSSPLLETPGPETWRVGPSPRAFSRDTFLLLFGTK